MREFAARAVDLAPLKDGDPAQTKMLVEELRQLSRTREVALRAAADEAARAGRLLRLIAAAAIQGGGSLTLNADALEKAMSCGGIDIQPQLDGTITVASVEGNDT